MTGEAMRAALDWIETLTRQSQTDRLRCGQMLEERDKARIDVERLNEDIAGHRELVSHLNKKISDLELDVSVERLAHANTRGQLASEKERANTATGYAEQLKAQLAAERAKESGPVEGTWAWACEYVVKNKNKVVTRAGGGAILSMYMDNGGNLKNTPLCNFEANIDDILATDWRVVES